MLKSLRNLPKAIVGVFTGLFAELKKVEWMPANRVLRLTLLVMFFLIFGALLIVVIDKIFLLVRGVIISV